MATRPLFITLEGTEGTGKTTQLERIAGRLRDIGIEPVTTREPGGTALGRDLRNLLLDPGSEPISPEAELLLYAADRAQHLKEVVEPALAAGRVVLCDRYLDATLAYQGSGRGLGVEGILEIHRRPPLDRRPDRTLLLDIDAELALDRARQRNADSGLDRTEGRFEQERIAFHDRVRQGYLRLAARRARPCRRSAGWKRSCRRAASRTPSLRPEGSPPRDGRRCRTG